MVWMGWQGKLGSVRYVGLSRVMAGKVWSVKAMSGTFGFVQAGMEPKIQKGAKNEH